MKAGLFTFDVEVRFVQFFILLLSDVGRHDAVPVV